MANASMSLQRWLARGFLRSLDEEDLMALTEAIVLEASSRRAVTLQLQPDERGIHTLIETLPTPHEAVLDTQGQAAVDVSGGIQTLPARLAEPQEESPDDT